MPASRQKMPRRKAGAGLARVEQFGILLWEGPRTEAFDIEAWADPDPIPSTPAPRLPVAKFTTTRHCWMACSFCDFSRFQPFIRRDQVPPGLSVDKARTAARALPPVSLIKVRGGLSLKEPFGYWVSLVRAIRAETAAPLQVLSPAELYQHHRVEKRPVRDLLAELKWAGATYLGPGGGEILVDPLREKAAPLRLNTETWLAIARLAAQVGVAPTATLMVGGLGTPDEWRVHIDRLKQLAGWHHIEIKPFRPDRTQLGTMGPPHLVTVLRAVRRMRAAWPDTPLYLSGPALSADGQILATAAGIDGFYQVVHECEP